MKKMPIGISNFKEIIEKDYYYIDKTLLIKDILNDGSKAILITRPRRFGKTINMSMLKYFFEKSNEDRTYLFNGLKIYNEKKLYNENQGKYPVIFITLKDIKNSNWGMTYEKIKNCIEKEYDRFECLSNSSKLTEIEKEVFNNIREGNASEIDYENSLKYLTEFLHKHYGIQPILLLDEYDVPIQSGYINGFYEEIIEFIRNWLSGAIKDNNHINFAIMTGILRIGKESIFSGMNNLKVCTILDNQYSEYFGFTDNEIIKMLQHYNREHELDIVKEWYDGYMFGKTEIYNPWSIINYIDNKDTYPKAYWLNTSSNDIIHDVIKNSNENIQKNLTKLMEGHSIEEIIDTNIIYPDIYKQDNYIFSLLLLSGYLKANDNIQNEFGFTVCNLQIPNKEIKIAYRQVYDKIK